VKNLVFASRYCLIDPSSGAAIATNDCLQFLADSGFRCQAYCSASLDFSEEVCFEETISELALPYEVRNVTVGGYGVKMVFTRIGNVPVSVFRNQMTRPGPMAEEIPAFQGAYERFLETNRPDVVVTYGGGPMGDCIIDPAKGRRIPVVFALHNLAYSNERDFHHVDYVIVPSQFSKDHYWEHLGLHCNVLPNVIDLERVTAKERNPQYVTFVNPQVAKGAFVFARIAEQIARRRPDIPLLVVESRDRARTLERTGIDLSWATNLNGMANTTDPRKFYAVTKVMLMPSVCEESFGLVAAEAMLNGIPVLASNRGALPETVGDGGLVFEIPPQYTPVSTVAPTAEEVEPWVEAIIRLWDDEEFYRQQSEKALEHAKRWHPERLRPVYEEFFRNLQPQPGPPIVWRGDAQAVGLAVKRRFGSGEPGHGADC
jgi:glycosyltransferase involved in cell wall biosynthesis